MNRERKCLRCGQCCNDVQLKVSPENMERFRLNTAAGEAHIVSLMLEYKFKASSKIIQNGIITESPLVYHYRCNKVIQESSGLWFCTIQDRKTKMCTDFPVYFCKTPAEREEKIAKFDYPSQYKGCGYNVDDKDPVTDFNIIDE